MRTLLLLPLLLLLTLAACDTPQNGTTDAEATTVDPENPPEVLLAALDSATARAHLEILSSDAMEGRGTGQPGEERAVAYIAEQMEAAGLEPAGDDGSFSRRCRCSARHPHLGVR